MMRGPFFLSALIVAVILFAVINTVFGQPVPQPPPMIIEPADADEFREVVETTIPPRYNRAIIRWYTTILQRQQAKVEAKQKEDEKK